MVRGLGRFREHFAGFRDRYALIGGAAVFIVMDEAGLDFRVTKDLDIVLFVETLDAEFSRAFWDFVVAGGYENRQRSTGRARFYRFFSPGDNAFPEMIELFSRKPETISLPDDAHLAPIPVPEEALSLSAILMDEDYYGFVRGGAHEVQGISVIGPEHLIPLKAKAWLDLSARRAAGEPVSSNDVRKHRNDVMRLFQLISPEASVALPARVRDDLAAFLDQAFDQDVDPKSVGVVGVTLEEMLSDLRRVYGVGS